MASSTSWNETLHPRGPVGRFITVSGPRNSDALDRGYDPEELIGESAPYLEGAELAALQDYTDNTWVNPGLRLGDHSFDAVPEGFQDRGEYVGALDAAIDRGILEEDTKVYRGVGFGGMTDADFEAFRGLQPGDQLLDRGFMSTSTQKGVTEMFGGVVMEIDAPAGTRVALPGLYSDWARPQSEVLIGRGSVLEVDSVEWTDQHSGTIRARLVGYVED